MASSDPALLTLLREADDDWLARLLDLRADLARPVPSSLTSLAGRASTRASAARAIAALDLRDLTVLEALVVLTDGGRATTTLQALTNAVGSAPEDSLERLQARALVVGPTDALVVVSGAAQAVGGTPLGLGPRLHTLGVRSLEGIPTTPPALRTILAEAPEGARTLLEALTWGPPVGTLGTTVPPAARWLLDRQVLQRMSPTEVVLPLEVALAARGNRLARDVAPQAPIAQAPVRSEDVVAAEVVAAVDEIVRHLGVLLDAWAEEPPTTLRAGGVAARDLKRLATLLNASAERAALVCELAGMLGLLGHVHDDDATRWAPTQAAEVWREQPTHERWAELVTAWLGSARVPWLAGTRNDRGALRSALAPDLHRSWAAPLRLTTLTALSHWPQGAAPSPEQVRAHLHWTAPRSAPPLATVAAVLAEAQALGLLGAGALGGPARVLLEGGERTAVAAALHALYPSTVGEMIVQGDLTGIVPGRPTPELADLLEACADVDSRGAALTVRFSADSIGRALAGGHSADELLARLRSHSRAPLPQPLEYLVNDVARRHRQVRIQPAATILRADDEEAAAALLGDPALAGLGLRAVSATVLAADATPLTVHEALRHAGAAPVLESADGRRLQMTGGRARAARPAELEGPPREGPVDLAEAVAALRAGEERAAALLAGTQTSATPAEELALLRAAAAQGTQVRIVVAGDGGAAQERLVRPLSVEGGRVRALDPAREAEITVATHRIVAVRPA